MREILLIGLLILWAMPAVSVPNGLANIAGVGVHKMLLCFRSVPGYNKKKGQAEFLCL
jgi:hypothetical protein